MYVCALCTQRADAGVGFAGLELQMVASCDVGAGIGTRVLCKTKKYS